MWAYNQQEDPPDPFLTITLRHPDNPAQFLALQAKIDTGADISAMPATAIKELGLPVTSKLTVAGYDGIATIVTTYAAVLVADKIRFKSQEIIAIDENHALLGRDILNHFYVQLNGPDLNFEISTKPF